MEVIINSIQNNPNFAEEEDEEAKKEQVYLANEASKIIKLIFRLPTWSKHI
jgi:hypothetical protein